MLTVTFVAVLLGAWLTTPLLGMAATAIAALLVAPAFLLSCAMRNRVSDRPRKRGRRIKVFLVALLLVALMLLVAWLSLLASLYLGILLAWLFSGVFATFGMMLGTAVVGQIAATALLGVVWAAQCRASLPRDSVYRIGAGEMGLMYAMVGFAAVHLTLLCLMLDFGYWPFLWAPELVVGLAFSVFALTKQAQSTAVCGLGLAVTGIVVASVALVLAKGNVDTLSRSGPLLGTSLAIGVIAGFGVCLLFPFLLAKLPGRR